MEVPLRAAGAPSEPGVLPLVDPSVLAELDAELPGSARRFAVDFARLWGRRRDRLVGAVAAGGTDEAVDAVLSLKVSSMMVGAQRLAWEAARLESALRAGGGDLAQMCAVIAECGSRTVEALGEAWSQEAGH